MSLTIPPGFAAIGIEFVSPGDPDPWVVTFGVDASEAESDPQTIGNRAMASMWSAFSAHLGSGVKLAACQVTIGQDGEEDLRTYVPAGSDYTGQDSQAMLPQNCAALFRKNTGRGGRRHSGRFFMPSVLKEGTVDAVGNIAGFEHGELMTAGSVLLGELNSDPGNGPPLPMYLLHGKGLSEIPDPTKVTSIVADTVISTQRRRLR